MNVKVNSVVKLYTLCLLNKGPKHGYEIIKELSTKLDRSISASHVYPFLKNLEKNNVVNCVNLQERDKKQYELTEQGMGFVSKVFGKMDDIIDSLVEQKICSCSNCDCQLYDNSYQERIAEETLHFCCCHCAENYKKGVMSF